MTVLARQKLRRYRIAPDDERQILVLLGSSLPSVDVDFPLRDPDDAPVVGAALVGRADAIVTGDRGLLEDAGLRAWLGERGVEVLTPAELLDPNHGRPVAKLVAYKPAPTPRKPGMFAGRIEIKPGFDEIPEGFARGHEKVPTCGHEEVPTSRLI